MKAGRLHPAAMPIAYGAHLGTTKAADYARNNPKKAILTAALAAGIPTSVAAINRLRKRRKQTGGNERRRRRVARGFEFLNRYREADKFAEKATNKLGEWATRPAFTAHYEGKKLIDVAKKNPKSLTAAGIAAGLGLAGAIGLNKLRKRKNEDQTGGRRKKRRKTTKRKKKQKGGRLWTPNQFERLRDQHKIGWLDPAVERAFQNRYRQRGGGRYFSINKKRIKSDFKKIRSSASKLLHKVADKIDAPKHKSRPQITFYPSRENTENYLSDNEGSPSKKFIAKVNIPQVNPPKMLTTNSLSQL